MCTLMCTLTQHTQGCNMADILVKVNLPNVDCRNIYFINNDEVFSGKEITKAPTYIPRDFKLVLRITYVNQSCVRTQTKKTLIGPFCTAVTITVGVRGANGFFASAVLVRGSCL